MTVDLVWLIVLTLAARRMAGLILEDDFGPFTDLRTAILSRWPGPDTQFLASEIVDAEWVDRTKYGETKWQTDRGIRMLWEPDDDGIDSWWAVAPSPVGQLFSCIRCMSVWTAAVGLLLWTVLPGFVWWPAALVLAVSEATILLEGE